MFPTTGPMQEEIGKLVEAAIHSLGKVLPGPATSTGHPAGSVQEDMQKILEAINEIAGHFKDIGLDALTRKLDEVIRAFIDPKGSAKAAQSGKPGDLFDVAKLGGMNFLAMMGKLFGDFRKSPLGEMLFPTPERRRTIGWAGMIGQAGRGIDGMMGLAGQLMEGNVARAVGSVGDTMIGLGATMAKSGGVKAGIAMAGVGAVAKVMGGGTDLLTNWLISVKQSNYQFAEFSSAMNVVRVRDDIFQMNLSRTRGERRAQSAAVLNAVTQPVQQEAADWADSIVGAIGRNTGPRTWAFLNNWLAVSRVTREATVGATPPPAVLGPGEGAVFALGIAEDYAAWFEYYGRPEGME